MKKSIFLARLIAALMAAAAAAPDAKALSVSCFYKLSPSLPGPRLDLR